MARGYRRRRYLIAKKFQLRFAGMIVFFMVIVAFFSSITMYYYLWVALGEKLANVYPQGRLIGILRTANLALFVRLLLIAPLVFVFAIVLSHRIAGPIYRIRTTLDEILKGDYSKRLFLRKTDELKDIADRINSLIDLLDKKDKELKNTKPL